MPQETFVFVIADGTLEDLDGAKIGLPPALASDGDLIARIEAAGASGSIFVPIALSELRVALLVGIVDAVLLPLSDIEVNGVPDGTTAFTDPDDFRHVAVIGDPDPDGATEGNDVISSPDATGDLVIDGLGGDDIVETGSGDDTINGGAGNDRIEGGAGDDTIHGDGGNDSLDGNGGNDRIWGGAGDDAIAGGDGNDVLRGGGGDDTLFGSNGNDRLIGQAGRDALNGGNGRDVLNGGGGNDTLDGGLENDRLAGGGGADVLDGFLGDDRLTGGAGADILNGGLGDDVLRGGGGADVFVFTRELDQGTDRVLDFDAAEDVFRISESFGSRLEEPGPPEISVSRVDGDTHVSWDTATVAVLEGVSLRRGQITIEFEYVNGDIVLL